MTLGASLSSTDLWRREGAEPARKCAAGGGVPAGLRGGLVREAVSQPQRASPAPRRARPLPGALGRDRALRDPCGHLHVICICSFACDLHTVNFAAVEEPGY